MASWYNSHSQFPDDDLEDLEVSWLDAMYRFENALEWNGMRLKLANSKEVLSGNNTVLRSYKDYELSGLKLSGLEISLGDYYWIIDKADAETAMILNNRSTLLLMVGFINADYLNEAEANSKTALQIYNSLPADKREGIQNTYHNLALITMYKDYIESGNKTINPTTAKTYCEWMEQNVKYTKKWCGQSKTTAVALENMGFAYLLAEDPDSAKESFLEAKSIFENLGLAEDAAKQDEFLEDAENFDLNGTWEVDI